jgi:hypothetical protein
MRSLFTVACISCLATVDASFIDSVKKFYNEWPVTAEDARRKYAPELKEFHSTQAQLTMAENAHFNVRAQR